ncbi:CHASE2 domain-containing protein [Anabaena azotica]|uniref:CHASE2 domain-containing protein n=1 Tax=Anabaena azotica TaxID=197653 RepID=UPI0039A75647
MNQENSGAESIAHNEESLQDLAWAIDMSQGQFSLILARCNYIYLRQELTTRLKEICPVEIHEIVLEASAKRIYTTIRNNLAGRQPAAVMVLGLESVHDINQLLTSMNVAREEFRKNCLFPLVLWINDEISQKLIRLAPDIYSWATLNVFEISAEILSDRLQQQTDILFTNSLELGTSQFLQNGNILDFEENLELQAAWRELQKQEQKLSPALRASLEFALGREDYVRDKIDNALIHYQQSLNFWQESHQTLHQAVLLFNFGWCYFRKAYLDRTDNHNYWHLARSYFQQCIQILKLEQRPDLVSKFISPWCEVLRQIQDWQALDELARQSLELHKSYGTETQLAQDYGFLAEVYLSQEQPASAKEMSEAALEILAKNPAQSRQKGLYLFILARSLRQLEKLEEAVKNLEIAKQEDLNYNPRLYIKILEELRSLYFEKRQYLKAFEIKQTQRSLEQQFGFRAFIGAGRLQAQRKFSKTLTHADHQESIAEEIIASGRQRDITRLIERIGSTQHKLTVIHGQSGVGKSSLVNAGLFPALKLQTIGTRDLVPLALRVYTDWIRELGQLLAETNTNNSSLPLESTANIIEQLNQNSESNLLTVLIFDQFEEFFFVCKELYQRIEFFEFLGDCLNIPDVKIVISMREDYLHYLLIANKMPQMAAINNDILSKNVLYPLGNFLPADAKEFITGLYQLHLEPALIDEVVKDLASKLGEVRPVELQIVGAQMQTEGISTLAQYQQLGPKEKLVQRYLEEIIQDCGAENEQVAQILLYLLTDENNTRPLKTLAELEKDLKSLAADLDTQSQKIGLVLEIFVKSGFVFLLPEHPSNRYQLVHDYLVTFIRRQQQSQLSKLLLKIETEKQQRQQSEEQLRILEKANKLFVDAQQKAKRERLKLNNWLKLQMLLVSVGIAGFVTLLRFLGLLQPWEWGAFDQYMRWRPSEPRDHRVVIVGINEKDFDNLKQATITDQVLAKLLNKLKAKQPRAIGLDVYRNLPLPPGTSELDQVFKSTPNLVGIQKVVGENKYERVDPHPVLKKLGQVGANDLIIDADNKVRRGIMSVNPTPEETVYSFNLHLALHYLEKEGIIASKDWQIGKTKFTPFESNDGGYVRADAGGYQILINYRRKAGSFDTVSMTDILEDKVPADWGRDRIILIGYIGESFKDSFFTPYSIDLINTPETMSGVEIHGHITSQIISSALEGRPLIQYLSEQMEIMLILFGAGIGVLLAWKFPSWQTSITGSFVMSSIIIGTFYIAFIFAWWLPVIPVLLALMSSIISMISFNEKQLDKKQLSRTIELILEPYNQNPEASHRALEYFIISNQGTKVAQKNIINIVIYTLKSCQNVNDIADLFEHLTRVWIPLSEIKASDLTFIAKFIDISGNLHTILKTNSNSSHYELIESSIAILKDMLISIDNDPKSRQVATFRAIIDQWLVILIAFSNSLPQIEDK